MSNLFQFFACVIIGLILIWLGYAVYSRVAGANAPKKRKNIGLPVETGTPGDPRTCPVCGAKLRSGERVKSAAFPGLPGQGRLMHIHGCQYCMDGSRRRRCPVCGMDLEIFQILVARIFDRPGRSHVHVLGCSHCREALASNSRRPA